MYSQQVLDTIRVLIIQPDDSHETREIDHDLRAVQEVFGDYIQRVKTPHCDIFFDKEGKLKGYPVNMMATYLWWNLYPEAQGVDFIVGPAFVVGLEDDAGYPTPVSDAVIELYGRIEAARREEGD